MSRNIRKAVRDPVTPAGAAAVEITHIHLPGQGRLRARWGFVDRRGSITCALAAVILVATFVIAAAQRSPINFQTMLDHGDSLLEEINDTPCYDPKTYQALLTRVEEWIRQKDELIKSGPAVRRTWRSEANDKHKIVSSPADILDQLGDRLLHAVLDELFWRHCPDGEKGMIKRPTRQYYVSVDGVIWCTYGDGRGIYVAFTPTDENGVPIAFAPPGKPVDMPEVAGHAPMPSSPPTDRPPTAHDKSSPTKTDNPPTTTAGDRPPTTTDIIPPATDTPSSNIPDTVIIKANQIVLEGGQTGTELQTAKLTLAKPDLPGTGQTKTTQDTGFDRDPAQCTTDADGQCTIEVHPGDRALYGLASTAGKSGRYRLDLNLFKHSGAVAETTGRSTPDLKDAAPAYGKLIATEFRIGNRTFTRLAVDQPYGKNEDLGPYSAVLGVAVKTDYCRTKKPGPPLGLAPASLSSLNHELPEDVLRLGQNTRFNNTMR